MWSGAMLASLLASLSAAHTQDLSGGLWPHPLPLTVLSVVCDLAKETVLSGTSDSKRVWQSLKLYHLAAARDLGHLRPAQLLVQLVTSLHWNRLHL